MPLKPFATALELSTGCDCPSADLFVRAAIKVGYILGICRDAVRNEQVPTELGTSAVKCIR